MAKKKVTGLQIAVYDVGKNPLSPKVIDELEGAVVAVLQQYTTLAHTVVAE